MPSISHSPFLQTLALGAGLLVLTASGPAWAQQPAIPKTLPAPKVATPPTVQTPTGQSPDTLLPTIIVPGMTLFGVKLSDTVIYEHKVIVGDFCTTTTTATSVEVVCDIHISTETPTTTP